MASDEARRGASGGITDRVTGVTKPRVPRRGKMVQRGARATRSLGGPTAAELILRGVKGAIRAKTVTYDFHRLMEGATLVKCSEFGNAVIHHMG